VHLQVDGNITVFAGHEIGEDARHRAIAAHPEVLDVLIHLDAENDAL